MAGPGKVVVESGPAGGGGADAVTVEADRIILATGSEPARLPMFDFSHPNILTSTEALALEKAPESLLIVGAGVIGCEFASFYHELGTKITMVEMLPQMLPLEDVRLAKQFQGTYRKRGIQVLLKTKVESISEYADDHVTRSCPTGRRSPPRRSSCRWAASRTPPVSVWRRLGSRSIRAATWWLTTTWRPPRQACTPSVT